MIQPVMNSFSSLYCSFLALTSAARVVFCMKNDRSMSLSPSSMILECLSVDISKKSEVGIAKDLHHRRTDGKHRLPFRPIQWQDGEESLQEWRVEQSKVQRH